MWIVSSAVNAYELPPDLEPEIYVKNAAFENDIGEGKFAIAPGVLPENDQSYGFDYRREYSPHLASIFNKYLKRPTPYDGLDGCGPINSGDYLHSLEEHEFDRAFLSAGKRIEEYERVNQEYLASDPRGLNFSAFVYVATLHAKYNELVTKNLKKR